MLTRAVALEAISTTIGGPPGRGAGNPMGLVPNMALLPPQGAMEAELLAKASPTSPRSASRSTNQPTTPAEYERAMASAAMPDASAMSTNRGSASKRRDGKSHGQHRPAARPTPPRSSGARHRPS